MILRSHNRSRPGRGSLHLGDVGHLPVGLLACLLTFIVGEPGNIDIDVHLAFLGLQRPGERNRPAEPSHCE